MSNDNRIQYLYKLIECGEGELPKNYGITIAEMSGFPKPIIENVKSVIHELMKILNHHHHPLQPNTEIQSQLKCAFVPTTLVEQKGDTNDEETQASPTALERLCEKAWRLDDIPPGKIEKIASSIADMFHETIESK
jgi:DNA mismatch repair ATPase MutS